MEEMGQRRGGKGMLSWEEVSTFSLGAPCTWAAPRGSSEDPRCPLWAVWVTLITGTVTGSSGPHGVIALPLPLQSLPPTHESPGLPTTPVLPETPEGGGHQTLDAELRQEEPWPLRKEKAGGWVNRWEGGRIEPVSSDASGKWRGGLIHTSGITRHRML